MHHAKVNVVGPVLAEEAAAQHAARLSSFAVRANTRSVGGGNGGGGGGNGGDGDHVKETDKTILAAFLTADPAVNIYAIGDLDPAVWDDCSWDGLRKNNPGRIEGDGGGGGGGLQAVALTYRGLSVPALQLLVDPLKPELVRAAELLLTRMAPTLGGGRFEAHLNVGFERIFQEAGFTVSAHPHLRMAADSAGLERLKTAVSAPASAPTSSTATEKLPRRLTADDAEACMELCSTLERSWFEPQCLAKGLYYGISDSAAEATTLVAMAGTHVVSTEYNVAALGNVVTRTEYRRRGYGRAVTRALCLALVDKGIRTVGLNVAASNGAAISMYASLHFKPVMEFVECDVN